MLALLGVAPSGAWAGGDETVFLSGIEDLPLMPGLEEDIDSAVVFDSANGRYVEAFAQGAMSAKDLTIFYKSALPQLGWHKTGEMTDFTFEREDEALLLDISENSNGTGAIRVRFVLSPKK
jgi:hypothetical protein